MIVPAEIARRYQEVLPLVRAAGDRVSDILLGYCRREGFAFAGRIKDMISVAEKIESGRFASWSDLDDLYAGTIIVPLVTDEPKILSFLEDTFVVDVKRLRGQAKKDPEVFRFDSSRIIARLRPSGSASDEVAGNVSNVRFEVQIKTAFEYAWSTATHALAYKAGEIDWRRQRLAAQLKAAVEQLDMLIVGYDSVLSLVDGCEWPSLSDKMEIAAFFKRLLAESRLPAEYAPKDWTRCAENIYAVFLMYAGKYSRSMQAQRLQVLGEYLGRIESAAKELGLERIPRSLSLTQFVHGVLGSNYVLPESGSPMPVVGQETLATLFPCYRSSCPEFDVNG